MAESSLGGIRDSMWCPRNPGGIKLDNKAKIYRSFNCFKFFESIASLNT